MKKVLKFLLSRMLITGLILVFQLGLFFFAIWKLSSYFIYVYIALVILSFGVTLRLMSKSLNPSYKMVWLLVILLFPGFGGLIYILYGTRRISKKDEKKMLDAYQLTKIHVHDDKPLLDELTLIDKNVANQARYLSDYAMFPLHRNTKTDYITPGEVKFERLKEELLKAKHFIFMEYFIIEEGKMWDPILEILEQKVKEGVEVRLMYDDVGCLNKLPYRYDEKIRQLGIKCAVFNPIGTVFNMRYNNRDHRKITIIDGHTGFTGGINLGDEYINENKHLGHWKDAALYLKGDAVWNLTLMFLQNWNYTTNTMDNYNLYKPHVYHDQAFEDDGYVLPYGDSPLDDEIVGELAYLNLINRAKDYIYINTPYLIVDNELVTALCLAAKSGVDVRIVTPHIADKWYVHIVTRGYYKELIKSGVKIYEYTPGFIHSKTFVCDDEIGIVGTINLDFRSLYLHFENAVWLYKTKSVNQIKEDYIQTLQVCQQITLEECQKVPFISKLIRSVLMIFAPLM
ncbi:MAG: cardiolipin synthase [Turicibacter sp.]